MVLRIGLLSGLAIALGVPSPVLADVLPERGGDRAQIFMGDRRMITTYGRGTASAPANRAELNFSFSNIDMGMPPEEGDDIDPLTDESLQPFVDMLLESGIAESDIDTHVDTYEGFYGPQSSGNIKVTIDSPTQVRLDSFVEMAEAAAAENDNLFYNSYYSQCSLENIAALEGEARLEAIADARSRIEAMADAIGAQIGEVLSMAEFHSFMPVSTSCSPPMDDPNLNAAPEVQIELGVLMTYGLR